MKKDKILIVDDEEVVVDALEGLLLDEGYNVVTAADGDEAIEQFKAERPDLIVLDAQIPKKDGFKVCREIKTDEDETLAQTLVIIITGAFTDPKSHARALLLSKADDFILKPFKSEILCHRIKVLLHKRDMMMEASSS
ncbi:MAG: response regulator [Proteobacteria bacterium]|nr:response regulator [Pseudomonadota bacterium]NIS68159.1 response regulator [Pseudomonadota bacterium]